MSFDPARLRRTDLLVAIGAVALFVFLFFLPWYGVGPFTIDGWHGHTILRWFMLATIALAASYVVLQATQRTPAMPAAIGAVLVIVAFITVWPVAWRVIIDEPGPNGLVSVKPGAWLGLAACVWLVYAGYRALRDERIPRAKPVEPIHRPLASS